MYIHIYIYIYTLGQGVGVAGWGRAGAESASPRVRAEVSDLEVSDLEDMIAQLLASEGSAIVALSSAIPNT